MESDSVIDAAKNEQNKKQEPVEPVPETPSNPDLSSKSKVAKVESEKKVTKTVIDKELLQVHYCYSTNHIIVTPPYLMLSIWFFCLGTGFQVF